VHQVFRFLDHQVPGSAAPSTRKMVRRKASSARRISVV
jgi:hypothetical protein